MDTGLDSLTPDSVACVSGFQFPLVGEMVFGSEQLEISWWQEQYQRAVIELRQREAALARSKALHQKALEREALLQQEIKGNGLKVTLCLYMVMPSIVA